MSRWSHSKNFKTALNILFIVISGILFYQLISNLGTVGIHLKQALRLTANVLSPLLYGMLFAFLMSPGVNFFEEKIHYVFTKESGKPKNKTYRSLAILLVYIILFGFIYLVIHFMVPQILNNIMELSSNIPQYVKAIESTILTLEETMDYAAQYVPPNFFEDILSTIQLSKLSPAFITSLFGRIFFGALNITSFAFNAILGFVIAFYLLKQSDDFANGTTRLMYAVLNKEKSDKIISIAKESNYIFARFFIGKALDSLIIGIICFVGLTLLKNRYALLLSLIVGVTNMIPYFGPFIGGIPAVLITLFEGFLPALFVALFILALQQFDGLYLGPKILGDSIGLSPFWIIISITIGGALWGALGMFFGAPLCAVILLLVNRWIDKQLERKNISLADAPDEEVDVE